MFGLSKSTRNASGTQDEAPQNPFFPQMALRRRSNDHPMVMFAALSGICLGAMALVPAVGPALVSAERGNVKQAEFIAPTEKGARVVSMSESDIACYGQAWGSEDEECLLTIARDSGRDAQHIRMIASADTESDDANLF